MGFGASGVGPYGFIGVGALFINMKNNPGIKDMHVSRNVVVSVGFSGVTLISHGIDRPV